MLATEPLLAGKVAFLSQARHYPAPTSAVRVVETHMSWVFLTDAHAWKLKKPLRVDHNDLSSVEARERHCRMEVRLNRRFSDDVYFDPVPLVLQPSGQLSLAGGGAPVDWLVKMRRLPGALMMDEMIRRRTLHPRDIRIAVEMLARFYVMCAPEPIAPPEWRAGLASRVAQNVRELAGYAPHVPPSLVKELGERQLAFLEREAAMLDARVEDGRIVEGHGDLRPEHICLEAQPRIIDCLEFSRPLRIVDAAEELGFLALECERLGAAAARGEILATYARVSGDRADDRLVHFYQGAHACVRARLALAHLRDAEPREPARWPPAAREYLRLAGEHLAQART